MTMNLIYVSQLKNSGNYILYGENDGKVYRNLKVTSTQTIKRRRLNQSTLCQQRQLVLRKF